MTSSARCLRLRTGVSLKHLTYNCHRGQGNSGRVGYAGKENHHRGQSNMEELGTRARRIVTEAKAILEELGTQAKGELPQRPRQQWKSWVRGQKENCHRGLGNNGRVEYVGKRRIVTEAKATMEELGTRANRICIIGSPLLPQEAKTSSLCFIGFKPTHFVCVCVCVCVCMPVHECTCALESAPARSQMATPVQACGRRVHTL